MFTINIFNVFFPLPLLLYLTSIRSLVLKDSKHETIEPLMACKDSTCDQITIRFKAFGDLFDVLLSVKKDLFSPMFFEGTQDSVQRSLPMKGKVGGCRYFSGSGSFWAAISVCDHIEVNGVLRKEDKVFNIHFDEKLREHHIDRDTDLPIESRKRRSGGRCGVSDSAKFRPEIEKVGTKTSPGSLPRNNPKGHKYLELLIVNDRSFYKFQDSSVSGVKRFNKDIANSVNEAYKLVNIQVVLMGIIIWETKDEIQTSSDAKTFLVNFSNYASTYLYPTYRYDAAHLFTAIDIRGDKGTVGYAFSGTICSPRSTGIDSKLGFPYISKFSDIVVHEIGHNLGLHHDTDTCSCPLQCYMAQTSFGFMATGWSSCSIKFLASNKTQDTLNECLLNVPGSSLPSCGNGFVEAEETCDCPINDKLCPSCCNTFKCQLKPGKVCSTEVCCRDCQMIPQKNRSVCRAKESDCDTPEHCEGRASCPGDVFQVEGKPCQQDKGFCTQGICKSRDSLCKSLFGPNSEDGLGYEQLNKRGVAYGHCGHIFSPTRNYKACDSKDVYCGLSHCKVVDPQNVDFSRIQKLGLGFSYYLNENEPGQHSITIEFNSVTKQTTDPALVWDYTKCGDNQWCSRAVCVPKPAALCPENCNGHGACANGRCTCKSGFLPPACHKACPENCNGNGTCIKGTCTCDPLFQPPNCKDLRCPGNCNPPKGVCDPRTGVCECKKGFVGFDCASKRKITLDDLTFENMWPYIAVIVGVILVVIAVVVAIDWITRKLFKRSSKPVPAQEEVSEEDPEEEEEEEHEDVRDQDPDEEDAEKEEDKEEALLKDTKERSPSAATLKAKAKVKEDSPK